MSICDRCSPSEREARRDPTSTNIAIFGKTTNVAMKNCQSATECIDYRRRGERLCVSSPQYQLTAKSVFEYTHGGNGDARISIIRGKPLLAYGQCEGSSGTHSTM